MAFDLDATSDELSFSVPGSAEAPREARHTLAGLTAELLDVTVLEVVMLLTSELVANCVRHAGASDGRPIAVAARVTVRVLRVEVSCTGPSFDHRPRPPVAGEPPHGLYYVDALAERWAIEPGSAPAVWFEVSRDPDAVAARWTRPS